MPTDDGHNKVKVHLTARTAPIEVGGYVVTTENYNRSYLTPVVEAMPGDTVAARLENLLDPITHADPAHGNAGDNPTNLHYFHGGIVTPNNARPKPAEEGNGDNVYVRLKAGTDTEGNPNRFEYEVPVPGEGKLDARVLEGKGYIPHPLGLNWYHSHMHGLSSAQVMGGMSGLLSVGSADANVVAVCEKDPADDDRCLNDVAAQTAELKQRTEVRYALLRDISLKEIGALPEQAAGSATAVWDPDAQDFPTDGKCGVWSEDGAGPDIDNANLRRGFCQFEKSTVRLYTINGQRFPTITVAGGKNLLLRLGNLSANVPYWLELYNEADGTPVKTSLLSLDGVVPTKLVPPGETELPVEAQQVPDLLLMSASRAEIYIRNDTTPHREPQYYVLKTKELNTGTDKWPEIQLARIVLLPNEDASEILVALNASSEVPRRVEAALAAPMEAEMPTGCVRDLDSAHNEYRRVTFNMALPPSESAWTITTEIIRPAASGDLVTEGTMTPEKPAETTVGPFPFEDYVNSNGHVDWESEEKKHACIFIDDADPDHKGSHAQLWVLSNATNTLHNFHIHQIKFRLATKAELESHRIKPPASSSTCTPPPPGGCKVPDYKLYEEVAPADLHRRWHDTIPMPPLKKVFVVMSFDAKEQVGRFVYHCHILKHEDKGLMAPIEVWKRTILSQ